MVRDVAVRVVVGAVVVVVGATECVSVVVATEREVVVDVGLVAAPDPATTSAAGGSDTPRIPSASTIQRRT